MYLEAQRKHWYFLFTSTQMNGLMSASVGLDFIIDLLSLRNYVGP